MTLVVINCPGFFDGIRLEIQERDNDPSHLNVAEAEEVVERVSQLWDGVTIKGSQLPQLSFQVGFSVLTFNQLLARARRSGQGMTAVNNIRVLRSPDAPFRWQAEGLSVKSFASAPRPVDGGSEYRWTIDVVVRLPAASTFLALEPNDSRKIRILQAAQEGTFLKMKLEVQAPGKCYLTEEARTYYEVALRLQTANGEKRVLIPVDHECLAGDTFGNHSLENFVTHASRPSVTVTEIADEILHRLQQSGRPISPDTVRDELYRSIRLREGTYRSDPGEAIWVWPDKRSEPYVLSPDETIRYGGDCEDWAILVFAVLSRLGFQPEVMGFLSHIFVRVRGSAPGSPYVDFDFARIDNGKPVDNGPLRFRSD